MMSRILVTGGLGFLAGHCIIRLLNDGYSVRATVRSPQSAEQVKQALASTNPPSAQGLEIVQADLTSDDGWPSAMAGCEYVLHVASPFPATAPKADDELIRPAREGTLRVLRAARDAQVRRAVVTSSFAAVGYGGKPKSGDIYTESDWTDPLLPNPAYIRSKAIAERAAWDFVDSEGRGLELAVVNPVGIFGPVLGTHVSSSTAIVKRLLEGAMPGLPDIWFGVVDVRDVADLHIKAMLSPQANGERFIGVAGGLLSLEEIATMLQRRLGAAAVRVPTKRLPNWQVRLSALFSPAARQLVPNLGKKRESSSQKARQLLGWSPRSNEDTVVSTAESLLRLGLLSR